jgi:hypothetical protein
MFRNGVLQTSGADYALANKTVTFFAASNPQPGDALLASYRYADASNPLSSLTSPQVVCSATGTSTSAGALTSLGTCTIPAGLLAAGDRLEIQFNYGHTGAASGFTAELNWGGTTILSRSGTAADTVLAGRATIGIYAGGQSWDAQTWGSSLAQASSTGSASENTSNSVTITFLGQFPATSADSIALRNFTVIRYPAQTNP